MTATTTPPGMKPLVSRKSLPNLVSTNTFSTLVGATTALAALEQRKYDDTSYVQSAGAAEELVVDFDSNAADSIFTTAKVIGFRLKFRAASANAASSLATVQLLSGLAASTVLTFDVTIPTGFAEYTILFPAVEKTTGILTEPTTSDVAQLQARFLALDAANPLLISHVTIDTIFVPITSLDNFFSKTPWAFGWTRSGNAPVGFQNGVVSITAPTTSEYFEYTKDQLLPLPKVGLSLFTGQLLSTWALASSFYGFSPISVSNAGSVASPKFAVLSLVDSTGEKLALLKGNPSTYDVTGGLGEYQAYGTFPWSDMLPFMVALEWDDVDVRVYTHLSLPDPLFTEPLANLGAGTGSELSFYSGDGVFTPGTGKIRLVSIYNRDGFYSDGLL